MPISASERLRRFYDQFSSNDAVLILINADPDAIASAMAISRLLCTKSPAPQSDTSMKSNDPTTWL